MIMSYQVQVIGVCNSKKWIILEFLSGGDLIGFLRAENSGRNINKLIGISEDVRYKL